jgi:hypothetical protein
MGRDPSGYSDGPNLFQYARSKPDTFIDPLGLAAGETTELLFQESKMISRFLLNCHIGYWTFEHWRTNPGSMERDHIRSASRANELSPQYTTTHITSPLKGAESIADLGPTPDGGRRFGLSSGMSMTVDKEGKTVSKDPIPINVRIEVKGHAIDIGRLVKELVNNPALEPGLDVMDFHNITFSAAPEKRLGVYKPKGRAKLVIGTKTRLKKKERIRKWIKAGIYHEILEYRAQLAQAGTVVGTGYVSGDAHVFALTCVTRNLKELGLWDDAEYFESRIWINQPGKAPLSSAVDDLLKEWNDLKWEWVKNHPRGMWPHDIRNNERLYETLQPPQ